MTPILPAQLDWPSAVGNFILNYGALDWHVFDFLEAHMSPAEFDEIRNEHFQDRIKRMKKVVSCGKYPPEQQQAFARFFERLEPIRELRNHIAHGHLRFTSLIDGKIQGLTLSLPKDIDKGHKPETRHLRLEDLIAASDELNVLLKQFETLSGFTSVIPSAKKS